MKHRSIFLFMWGYQESFRVLLESKTKRVLDLIGVSTEPKVLLVGARMPNATNQNPVCVEPEDGEWPISLFSGLLNKIEEEINEHPLKDMFYGDAASMRDKPERIRRDSVKRAVEKALIESDKQNRVRSFCGTAYPIGDYYVVSVIQVPEYIFEKYPPLKPIDSDDPYKASGYPSFIHACLYEILEEALDELQRQDPGRFFFNKVRGENEIVRSAASQFMHTPGIRVRERYYANDLFERYNLVSSLMYEGDEGIGKLILSAPNNPALEYHLKFKNPVPFKEPRWARKILQMASNDISLISDSEYIYGLGKLSANHTPTIQNTFVINFLDHYHWEVCCEQQVLLRSLYGEPKLPQEPIDYDLFLSDYRRLFPNAELDDCNLIWQLLNTAMSEDHGSMLVIAEDAEEEMIRLDKLGTIIEPVLMSEELLKRVSGIDGTVILDPHGVCHGIGVILDGMATPDCTPSRGSRYNSGVRYVKASNANRLAIVISEDSTIDVIPELRPQMSTGEIERNILALEQATTENYHKPRKWADDNRFYLNASQCARVNNALDRIESLPREVGEIMIHTTRLTPDPEMEDSYLTP